MDSAWMRRAALCSAVLNGAMLASQLRDQVVLVPMWGRLRPEDFQDWFRHHATRAAARHAPLLLLGLAAAGLAGRRPDRAARAAMVGVGLHGGVTMLIHAPTNMMLLGTPDAVRIDRLRRRWIRWHAVRVAALAFGEAAAVVAMIKPA